MSVVNQSPSIGRRAVVGMVGLAVIVGIVVVFSGALTRSTDIEARAEEMRAETARIEAQVLEGERELEYVESKDFFEWEARAIGFGEEDEQPFVLPPDAPPPPPIVPIGPQLDEAAAMAPFDAWMELLFGA